MVEALQQINYKVTVVRHEVKGDHAEYLIKIIGPKDISFHICDRYSMIRNWQAQVKNEIKNPQGAPEFPPKKLFGNMEKAFLDQRRTAVEVFLNTFLAHPQVNRSRLVPVYFKSKAVAKEDTVAIQNLILFQQGKKVAPAAGQPAAPREPIQPFIKTPAPQSKLVRLTFRFG